MRLLSVRVWISWTVVFLCGCSWGRALPGEAVDEFVSTQVLATGIYDAENMAFDPWGRLFVSSGNGLYVITGLDQGDDQIRIERAISYKAVFAGLAMGPDGCLYAACFRKMKTQILRVDLRSDPMTYSVYLDGRIRVPNGIRFDDAGNLYAADFGLYTPHGGRIVRVVPAPENPDTAGELVVVAKDLWGPNSIVLDRVRRRLYFSETFSGRVYYLEELDGGGYDSEKKLLLNVGTRGPRFPIIDGMALDAAGNIYLCVYNSNRILVISPEGKILESLLPLGVTHPTALAFATGRQGLQSLYVTAKGHMFKHDRVHGDRVLRMKDVARPYRLPFLDDTTPPAGTLSTGPMEE